MAQSNVEQGGAHRWSERVFRAFSVSPILVGFGIALGLVVLFLFNAWAFGGLETFQARDTALWGYRQVRIGILVAMLAGYLPTARHFVAIGAERNFAALRPLLGATPTGPEEIERRFLRFEAAPARTAGLLGMLIAPITALIVDRDPGLYLQPGYWGPETGFAWLVGSFVGWNLGGFLYETLAYARRFSDLALRVDRIDLVDLRPLAPFARQGLRAALLWLVLISLLSVNALDVTWFGVVAAIALAGATAALVLPVRGVHLCLRRTKNVELERVNAALRGDLAPLAASGIAAHHPNLSLSDLLTYRAFVESVREWPFDAPTIFRFALYLVIPLGSWLGGALVERLLGAALD